MSARYEPVIGLEVHCQLKTASKMFSACPVGLLAEPNTLVDPYTLGLPGTLPVANAAAVAMAIRVALALGGDVQAESRWARKHYFYPDLPKGYQITQSDHPYCRGGALEVPGPKGREDEVTRVRLIRVHMEEDAGKSSHAPGEPWSLVDYNRAGAPLLEIVSEPDLRGAGEAARYLRELRAIIRALDVSDANMEEGTLRCDANVSLRPRGSDVLGARCEIKNLNSFKFLEQAIRAEVRRQTDLLDRGEAVASCTLSYDVARDETRIMRTKEEAADYRYFPEPDMPPLTIDAATVEAARARLPELPAARRARYRGLGVAAADARLLAADPGLAAYFDAALAVGEVDPRGVSNWMTGELLRRLKEDGRSIADAPVSPAWLVELIGLVERGVISARAAKDVLQASYVERRAPAEIVARDGHAQVSDADALAAVIAEVLAAHPSQLAQYKAGNDKIRGFLMGQVMKATRGQANPKVLGALLGEALARARAD